MSYEVFQKLCQENGVSPSHVSKMTGVATSTLTNWKKGEYTPKQDKLIKIANFFNVSLDYLATGKNAPKESNSGKTYYFNDETAEIAEELFENPRLRVLMDASRKASPESVEAVITLITSQLEKEKEKGNGYAE